MSTSDHPETDSQTASANSVLEEIFRGYAHAYRVGVNSCRWSDLPSTLRAYVYDAYSFLRKYLTPPTYYLPDTG